MPKCISSNISVFIAIIALMAAIGCSSKTNPSHANKVSEKVAQVNRAISVSASTATITGDNYNSTGSELEVCDFNSDGFNDLFVVSEEAGHSDLFLGPLTGNLTINQSNLRILPYYQQGEGYSGGITDASCGDMNGDGHPDLVVADGWYSENSRVHIFLNIYALLQSSNGEQEVTDLDNSSVTLQCPPRTEDRSGIDLDVGDLNNDRYDDLVIGVPDDFNDIEGEGNVAALVVMGRSMWSVNMDLNTQADATFMGEPYETYTGQEVSIAGDINGDTHPDLLVTGGYNSYDVPADAQAYIVYGPFSGTHPLSEGSTKLLLNNAEDIHIVGAGDTNGDGNNDVAVSDPYQKKGAGAMWLIQGHSNMTTTAPSIDLTALPPTVQGKPEQMLGRHLGALGDLNDDGYSEVAVSANGRQWIQVILYYGGATPFQKRTTIRGDREFGCTLGTGMSAGDINGDGRIDLTLGDYCYGTADEVDEGRAYVLSSL